MEKNGTKPQIPQPAFRLKNAFKVDFLKRPPRKQKAICEYILFGTNKISHTPKSLFIDIHFAMAFVEQIQHTTHKR